MRLLKIALLLAGILLLAAGADAIYRSARSGEQVSLTCEQFFRQRPSALWMRVTGCEIDYDNAAYRESRGRIAELFFPVRPAGEPRNTPAALVIATRDPAALALADRTIGGGRQPTQEASDVMMLQIITMLGISREVEGYARSGPLEMMQTRRSLAGLRAPLSPQLVVLDVHARPSFLLPGTVFASGAVLLLGLLIVSRRRAPTPEPVVATSPAEPAGEVPVAPAARRLPAVMLLNLPASADVSGVEHAPALGTRADITHLISTLLGWVSVDGVGRGTLSGPDWSLTLDLGPDDQVWTIAAEARGDGSIRALTTLVRGTGWRMFIPRQGAFVEAARLQDVDPPVERA